MNTAICPVCNQEIADADYRCAGIDRLGWRTIVTHAACFDRRLELEREHPDWAIVQPEAKPETA